jgi:hypothetical protein
LHGDEREHGSQQVVIYGQARRGRRLRRAGSGADIEVGRERTRLALGLTGL